MFRSARADIRALDRCLEAEHGALRTGAHDRLAPLAREKEALVARLAGRLAAADARRLSAALARNAALLQAAAQGVRAAQAQLAALRHPPETSVYHADGQRHDVTAARGRLERRA